MLVCIFIATAFLVKENWLESSQTEAFSNCCPVLTLFLNTCNSFWNDSGCYPKFGSGYYKQNKHTLQVLLEMLVRTLNKSKFSSLKHYKFLPQRKGVNKSLFSGRL